MEKIIEYIKNNYKAKNGAKTSMWSEGNSDDVFTDGEERGIALTLKDIAELIGLEVEPLAEQSFD